MHLHLISDAHVFQLSDDAGCTMWFDHAQDAIDFIESHYPGARVNMHILPEQPQTQNTNNDSTTKY